MNSDVVAGKWKHMRGQAKEWWGKRTDDDPRQIGRACRAVHRLGVVIVFVFALSLIASGFALAADDTKVKAATDQVERGGKKISDGKVGEGVEETAKGIGNTVFEGAKYSGERLKDAGKAAEPGAKTAWGNARDSAVGFGRSVKGFFTNLFSN